MVYLRSFFVLFWASFHLGLSGQTAVSTAHVERGVMPKISLLTPALAGEIGLDESTTFFLEATLGFAYNAQFSNNGPNGSYSASFPIVAGEVRKYYSLKYRERRGRVWRGNSGAFFGLSTNYKFAALSERVTGDYILTKPYQPSFSVGPVWGFQFTGVNRGNFNFSFSNGPGVSFLRDGTAQFTFVGHLNLGFVLGKYRQPRS